MSVHDDLREMWDADEGGPWEFLLACVVFFGGIGALFLLIWLLAPKGAGWPS